MSILSAPARLLDIFAFRFGLFGNGFFVSHLRLADGCSHAKLALHAVNYDFKVEFAHPPNYRLGRLGVCGNAESGVFLRKP